MTEKSYKIAIVGSADAVLGFRAVGADAVAVTDKADAEEKVTALYNSEDYAALFITEDWADEIRELLQALPPKALPAIVAVPSQAGSTGAGLYNLKKIVEQAVGSDILSKN